MCACVWVCVCVCVCVCECVSVCVCLWVCECMCMWVCVFAMYETVDVKCVSVCKNKVWMKERQNIGGDGGNVE